MARTPLPDSARLPSAAPVAPSTDWDEGRLARFLASDGIGPWLSGWMSSLRSRFDARLPALVGRGLGDTGRLPLWMRKGSEEARWLRDFLVQSDLADTWLGHGFLRDDPEWLVDLLAAEDANVARSFLLSGNVTDYAFDPVRGYRPATRLLVDALLARKHCVLTYRLSQGLTLHAHDESVRAQLPPEITAALDARGFRQGDPPLMQQICQLFDVLRRWLAGAQGPVPDSVAVVFENVHLIVSANSGDVERNFLVDNLLQWSCSPEIFRSSHCLILMAESLDDVSNDLRARGGKIEQIAVPRPDSSAARLKFIVPLLQYEGRMPETRVARLTHGRAWLDGYGSDSSQERLLKLAHDTAGLSLMGIEDLLQQAAGRGEPLSRGRVMALKRERLRQESDGLLEVVDPRTKLADMGGYDAVKSRLRQVVDSLARAADPLVRNTIPMGILFVGPPGTGKSAMAEALAGESDISMVKLGDFRGQYVGQSERNLSRIFGLLEALHPVLVFVDEIDQALGARGSSASGDQGVDRRIFGRMLEFIGNTSHRGRIVWIGASNYANSIDPAMKRPGRFDLVIPFLLPDEDSRAAMLRVMVRDGAAGPAAVADLSDAQYRHLAVRTQGYSGAELRAIVGEVLRRGVAAGATSSHPRAASIADFEAVLDDYRPAEGSREAYEEMTRQAVASVSFRNMLPAEYRSPRRSG